MADSKIIKPSETKNVSELFLNNAFKINIPRYQREYVWGEEQWTDLLNDILDEDLEEVFLGFLLVHHGKDGEKLNVYNIVDGQQRVLTLSILIAVLASLEEGGAQEPYIRNEVFLQSYKGTNFKKVSANIGKDFLDKILYRKDKIVKPDLKSEILLFECYNFFMKHLQDKIKTKDDVEKLYDRVKDEVTFSVTSTDSYENAIRLFQVLNDNSVKLSSTDLFKNYLLSKLGDKPDSELDEFASKWNDLQKECSVKKASFQDYLLRLSMSRLGYFKHNDLYSKLETILHNDFSDNPESFFEYVNDDVANYIQIFTHESPLIDFKVYNEIKFFLKVFSSLGVNEPITFFYTVLSVLSNGSIERRYRIIREIFKRFLNFTIVRYKLNGSGRAYMHQVYPVWSKTLIGFMWDKDSTIEAVLKDSELKKVNELNSKYFSKTIGGDSVVEQEIAKLTFSSNKENKKFNKEEVMVRYLLSVYYFGSDIKQAEKAFNTYSIEHIINDSNKQAGLSRFSIGNLLLVQKDSWGNASFEVKLEHYKREKHLIDSKDIVLEKKTWTDADIKERGEKIASSLARYLEKN